MGDVDKGHSDAGGVALKAWRGVTQTCRSVAAVRHRRCRRFALSSVHGFTLTSFGHHPRLRMVCPRRGQWVSTRDTQLNYIPAYRLCSCGYSRSLLRRSSLSHILYGMYAFVDTLTAPPPHPHLHRAASGGGALCLTAGDTRTIVRANPWRSGQTTALPSDAGSVALKASREYSSSLLL